MKNLKINEQPGAAAWKLAIIGVVLLMVMALYPSGSSASAARAEILWCVGPVDPMVKMEEVTDKIQLIQDYGLHPAVLVMMSYDNTDTRTWQDYAKTLNDFEKQGIPILVREPIINTDGTYGKDRAIATYDGLSVLKSSGILASGLVIEQSYEPDYRITHLQKLLPMKVHKFYVGKNHLKEDWRQELLTGGFESLLIAPNLSEDVLSSWLQELTDGTFAEMRGTPPLSVPAYQKVLEDWNANNMVYQGYLEKFLAEEEQKIAGRSSKEKEDKPTLDISKNVQIASFVVGGMAVGLSIMFLINIVLSRRKYIR